MSRLKVLPSTLTPLKPALGSLTLPARSGAAHRSIMSPWRKWYSTARWRALRMHILIRDRFTCQWPDCGQVVGNTSQLVADHKEPHRGDQALFWDEGNLQTLCKPCHDRHKQRTERATGI